MRPTAPCGHLASDNARYYDPNLGRFISADTIVPGAGLLTVSPHDATAAAAWSQRGAAANPQQLNRYSYVLNNPVRNTDPSGHCFGPVLVVCAAAVGAFVTDVVIPAVLGAVVIAGAAEAGQRLGQAHAAEQADAESSKEPLSVDDYLKGTTRVSSGKTKQHVKTGDLDNANEDFDRLAGGRDVTTYPDGRRSVELEDGTTISVRPTSSEGNPSTAALPTKEDGFPTIQINPPTGKSIKTRYIP